MKTIRKNLLLFIFLMSIVSMNLLTASTNSTTSGADEIRLRGLTDDPRPRVPPAPSLEAYLDYDAITIYFLNDLGNISITITDEWGTVMHQSVEPSNEGITAVIDISGLEPGVYTITFTNFPGSYYRYGEFEV